MLLLFDISRVIVCSQIWNRIISQGTTSLLSVSEKAADRAGSGTEQPKIHLDIAERLLCKTEDVCSESNTKPSCTLILSWKIQPNNLLYIIQH